MKTLEKLTIAEKAKLLHEWFPQEIPALLDTIYGMANAIQQEEPTQRTPWDSGLFSSEFSLNLLSEAEGKIKQYGKQMQRSSKLFAGQLFDGYVAFYSVYCLIRYAPTRHLHNRKFAVAVDLLFNP